MEWKEQVRLHDMNRRVENDFPAKITKEWLAHVVNVLDTDISGEAKEEAEYRLELMILYVRYAIANYTRRFVVPREFAALRRKAGDQTASPRDYDCTCYVRDDDGIPICQRRRPNCRFEGARKSHHPLPNMYQGLDRAREARWAAASKRLFEKSVADGPGKLAAELERFERSHRRDAQRVQEIKETMGVDVGPRTPSFIRRHST